MGSSACKKQINSTIHRPMSTSQFFSRSPISYALTPPFSPPVTSLLSLSWVLLSFSLDVSPSFSFFPSLCSSFPSGFFPLSVTLNTKPNLQTTLTKPLTLLAKNNNNYKPFHLFSKLNKSFRSYTHQAIYKYYKAFNKHYSTSKKKKKKQHPEHVVTEKKCMLIN